MSALVQRVQNLPAQQQEAAVSVYLEQARDRLAEALERTGPESVANIKAEIATAAEATKQLRLSKEIREDATEMVRRADFTLGKAIKKGQADGSIRTNGQRASRDTRTSGSDLVGSANEYIDVAAMAEVPEDEFEKALAEARKEGNLSRANVVRKVKGQQVNTETEEATAASVLSDEPGSGFSKLTGPNSVSHPGDMKPRRRPLTDQLFEATYDMARAVERVHRLTQDDRPRGGRWSEDNFPQAA